MNNKGTSITSITKEETLKLIYERSVGQSLGFDKNLERNYIFAEVLRSVKMGKCKTLLIGS